MVSSTVNHFKTELEQLCYTLQGYGYHVLNSHIGTIYSIPGKSPEESCLAAVEECDFFFGIILPFYGSGITHTEFKRAIAVNKPRGFLAHHDVAFSRQLLKQFMYDQSGDRNGFTLIKKTPVMDDLGVIDMYNEAVGDGQPLNKRLWAQEFYKYSLDGAPFVDTQFNNIERFWADLEKLKALK
ncbi:uncharacterized protein DUF4062 [Pontibacter ummariensis]|uniref:DUF4062 domain-containing protein n=2 Tax=Pontibacter ummariensis TaxID=1610492 RepID=A0A239LGT3_9BACT|nr:uncharacterized protein DUF4062 [Pontibacter ummariensis]SNT29867.1 protein of unknown function [Pontibacter ummariensis]